MITTQRNVPSSAKKESIQLLHLYRRAGFGLSAQEYLECIHYNREEALHALFRKGNNPEKLTVPVSPLANAKENSRGGKQKIDTKEAVKEEQKLVAKQNTDWLYRMAQTRENALLERMSLFWHDHFACEFKIGHLAAQQLNSIREHALGYFKDLVLAIAKDPAMIRYLNNQQNRKGQANENFARELMELFTIGRGQYSEQDIKEAARAFTGWSSNLRGAYVFRARQHDFGIKSFMGAQGTFDGEEIIDMILQRKTTAEFITRKLYRYFVNEKVDEARVKQLANQFYQSNYHIQSLMEAIFSSDWFYAPENIGVKIKSPVELMAGMMRQLGVTNIGTQALIGVQKALGQILFKPPNVAGWPDGKNWVDNSTLMIRLQLPMALYSSSEIDFKFKDEPPEQSNPRKLRKLEAKIDWQYIFKLTEEQDESQVYNTLVAFLLPRAPAIDQSSILPFVSKESRAHFVKTLCIRLMSLPEYQLC